MRSIGAMVLGGFLLSASPSEVLAHGGNHPGCPLASPGSPPRPAPVANRHSGGLVAYDVRDADTDEPIPCKLTFVGVDGTARPAFTHNDIGRPEGDLAIAAYDRVFSAVGAEDVRVPLGTYDIYISRGPEWDIAIHRKVVVGAAGAKLTARLHHVIDTRGWLSADFHVHAAPSPDSEVPLSHRIIEFVADGIDLLVSTDHNSVTNYASTVQTLGLSRYLATAMGDEITTNGWGHFGAFPLPQDLAHPGQGAVLVHGKNAREIFQNVRERAPGAIIDVHHPRIDPGVGYFLLGEFDPHSDRAGRKGFSFDFDALEVVNGYQDPSRKSVDKTIDDWLGLLNHGHLVTALGNSDTHHLTYNLGGYPRNYVRVPDDRPDHVSMTDVAAGVKGRHAFFTTGPFVRVSVGQAGLGDLASARGGKAIVSIAVEAAPWITVSRVIVYVSGKEAARFPVPPSTGVTRFKMDYEAKLAKDGYVVVRVDGDRIMAPVVGDSRTFGVYPLALTNPIFLDVDGNGKYDPEHAHGAH